MAKAAKGEKTREEIIQAGMRLFSLHGYFATSMNDILEAVSISKGAFYHHFKSKEELALAVLEKMWADYRVQLFLPVQGSEASERLGMALRRIVQLNESGLWVNCLLLARLAQETAQQESGLSEKLAEVMKELIGFWREIIEAAQKARTVSDKLHAGRLAELIVSVLLGAIICRQLKGEPISLEQMAGQIERLIKP